MHPGVQEYTNFTKIYKPRQNSKRQWDHMKQVPQWGGPHLLDATGYKI
jgi:hypothetical protein